MSLLRISPLVVAVAFASLALGCAPKPGTASGPATATAAPAPANLPPGATDGTDRNGSDYRDFDLDRAEPMLCLEACLAEAQCQAWTYVRPGVQGPSARCWLKNATPPPTPDACCVSGIRVGNASTVEN